MPDRAVPLSGNPSLGPGLLGGLAALGDILMLRAWLGQDLLMVTVMALHLCLALGFGLLFFLFCGRSPSRALAGFAILALFGPFGGPVLMLVGQAPASPVARPVRKARPAPALARPRDVADDLFDQISQRRRHPLPQGGLPGFLQTFRDGSLREQQEAIAAISRAYHPDMRPALSAALASPVPALRVQAAAVYAKLRGTYGNRAKDILSGTGGPHDRAAILEVAASGFVDEETADRLLALAAQAEPAAVAAAPAPGPAAPPRRSALAAMPRLKRHSCGGLA